MNIKGIVFITLSTFMVAYGLPSFRWIASHRSNGGSPLLQITRANADQTKATVDLKPYNPLPDVDPARLAPCLYHGKVRSDPSTIVAVTGCYGSDEAIQITVVGDKDLSEDGSNQFLLYSHTNVVEAIASPWEDGKAYTDTMAVGQHVANRWDDFGDELEDGGIEGDAETAADYCSLNAGKVECEVPAFLKMTMKIGYDDTLKAGEKDPVKWIGTVMTHTQVFFKHQSLGSEIEIQVVGTPKHYAVTINAEKGLKTVRPLAKGDMVTDLWAFFCKDPNYWGVVGMAYVGTMCKYNRWGYQTSVNEWRKLESSTAKIVAHEIGHNIGMAHDFATKHKSKGCTGVMNYGKTPDAWSKCSVADFKAHYEAVFKKTKKHCLDIV